MFVLFEYILGTTPSTDTIQSGIVPLSCPTCGEPLNECTTTSTGGALIKCSEGHTTAVAKAGEVNLVPSGRIARKGGVRSRNISQRFTPSSTERAQY